MPNIFISFFFLSTLIPISLRKLIAISNLGLSFLFNSPKFLKLDIPFAFAAIKKITKNSSIAALFKYEGQLKPLIFLKWKGPSSGMARLEIRLSVDFHLQLRGYHQQN